jgi:hypothetical protein
MIMDFTLPPWLALLLLAPAMGELLSGSSPPAEFFQPFGFTIMVALYGCGALVCRELKVRWRKGVGTLMLLGCGYGVLEEALMVASFYNPSWMDLGVLAGFGRALGVNWVWAVELTIYHALFSIVTPVLLVELAYPSRKATPWLTDRRLKIVAAVLLLDVAAGFILFASMLGFWPPAAQYLLGIAATLGFIYAAHRLPSDWARKGAKPMRRPVFYTAVGFLAALGSALTFGWLPSISDSSIHPLLVCVVGVALVYGVVRYLVGFMWREAMKSHLMGLVSGPVLLFILVSLLQELDASRPDDTSGMIIVGAAFLLLLAMLWLKIRRDDTHLSGATKTETKKPEESTEHK